jgi:D-inositol-3-phosphate glycosyltransferase
MSIHHIDRPARLRIAMLTEACTASGLRDLAGAAARIHLERLAAELVFMGHHVDVHAGAVPSGQRHEYDIAHAHSLIAGQAALRLHEASGVPYILSTTIADRTRAAPAVTGEPDTAILRGASRVLVTGPQQASTLERTHRIASERTAPLLRGFDPQELHPLPMHEARARMGLDHQRFIVLYVGKFAPRKGIDTLIQGVAMLRRRHAIDACLMLAGGALPDEALEITRLKQIAAELGVGEHVLFAGPQPRSSLRELYAAAHVFAATPWYEPFGLPPIEAMACARPLVVSELGAIGTVVDDGRTGFLIPSRDPVALVDRLARLHRCPGLARAMGEAGRRRACEQYTWRRQAAKLLDLYREALCGADQEDIRHAS